MDRKTTRYPYFLFVLTALLFCACQHRKAQLPLQGKVIVIQPFSDLPGAQAAAVYEKIKQIYPRTVLLPAKALPLTAYYPPRHRYRADTIIRYLSRFGTADTCIIGLTAKDISTTKNDKADWGVMGLGYCPGTSCVASTFRLSAKDLSEQFYKVAIHELGHTQGLPHCKVRTCFMRDAAGGNPLNEEQHFCASCSSFLVGKGWALP